MSDAALVFMACPLCSHIAELSKAQIHHCPICEFHAYHTRMRRPANLRKYIITAYGTGNEQKGLAAFAALDRLTRYATIVECMRVAGDAYSEASYAGVDAHGSYHSAMEALQELLEAMQDGTSSQS